MTTAPMPRDAAILFAQNGVMITGVIVSAMVMLAAGGDVTVKIGALSLLWVMAAASVRFDLAHPYLWFAGPFLIYCIAAPALDEMGTIPQFIWMGTLLSSLDYSAAINMNYLAMAAFVVAVTPRRCSFDRVLKQDVTPYLKGAVPVTIIFGAVLALAMVATMGQGITDKKALAMEGGVATRFTFYGTFLLALSIPVYHLYRTNRRWWAIGLGIALCVFAFFTIATMGQRSFLYRIVITFALLYHIAYRPIRPRTVLIAAVVGLLMNYLLGALKMALYDPSAVTDQVESMIDIARVKPQIFAMEPLEAMTTIGLTLSLRSEPMTATSNLAMLMDRVPHQFDYLYGASIYLDFVRAAMPGTLMGYFFGGWDSTQVLFNKMFFEHYYYNGHGTGFSLVGWGYWNGDWIGVILLFLFWGWVLKKIYHWASESLFGLFFMTAFVPIAIMTTRTDLSAPLGQGVKQLILPMLLILMIGRLRQGKVIGQGLRRLARRKDSAPPATERREPTL